MNDTQGYAVFFFPQALEVLDDAIRPYLLDGPAGPHVLCKEIDTGGAFIEMTLEGRTADGHYLSLELMVPGSMVRMIVSAHGEGSFGFGASLPKPAPKAVPVAAKPDEPVAAPSAAPTSAPTPTPTPAPAPAPAVPDVPTTVIAASNPNKPE